MLHKIKKHNDEKGFTIIEVLIVLAIAGLILLIVFLAVPALQRSTRNTGRKEDSSRIATAAGNFVSNNNGTLPAVSADITTIISDAGTLNQYPSMAVSSTLGTAAAGKLSLTTGAVAAISVDGMQLVTGAQCSTGGATVAGTGRQMALQYVTELPGSTYQGLCLNAS